MRVGFDRFTFDSETRDLLDAGTRLRLSPKAFELLRLLLERRPAVVSKREIHDHVWHDTFVSEANLSVVIAEIRQALGDDSRQARFIRTVHRVGYAFSGEAEELSAGSSAAGDAAQLCWIERDGRSVPLAHGAHVIGRDPRCAVWVDASGVSRRHARIDVRAGSASIVDLESRNGTFVAGQALTGEHRLADGDVIELGAARLTFRAWFDGATASTERFTRPTP